VETVLVTGGAGFIGSHLVERLLARGNRVICVDNFDPFYPPEIKRDNLQSCLASERFELVQCDIRNEGHLAKVFATHEIHSVVHLAARAGVRPSISNPALYQHVNVGGTVNLLELSRDCGIKNFVFGSSSSVYGASGRIPSRESEDSLRPVSPYAASKQAGELFCYTFHHLYHIPVTCLRFFTVYGPRQRPDMAIYKFTRLVDLGEPVPLYGDGSSGRDYTYISDVVDGIVSALDRKLDFEIINLGYSETTELRLLVSLIEQNLGKKADVRYVAPQPGDVPVTGADISKAQRLLGYRPNIGIREGIEAFIRWYKGQGNLCGSLDHYPRPQ